MRNVREALSTAGMIAALGSAVVFSTFALSRCAGAQDTATRMSRRLHHAARVGAGAHGAHRARDGRRRQRAARVCPQDIARRAKVGIVYDRLLPGLTNPLSLHATNVSAATAVLRALEGSPLDALVSPSGQIVLVRHAARPGRLRGLVLDSAGGPVPNAFIELGTTPLVAVSAADGSFAFPRATPGDHRLLVRRLGYRPAQTTVRVTDGDVTIAPVIVTLEPTAVPLTAMVVSPGYFGIMAQQVGSLQTLDREQIRTRPQLGDDLFRSINRLPGLSSDDFSAGFHVRGSQVDEMYVSFDGVQLVEPFHLKDLEGALSIIDVRSVSGIDLTTGGFTSEYGSRLGSLLAIRSVEADPNGLRTSVGLSITNLRLQTEGSFANGRGSWLVSGRRGYLDLALKLAGTNDSISPVYSDVFAKASWTFSDGNRITLHVLDADDGLHYTDNQANIKSSYGSRYGWLTWDVKPADALTGQAVLSASGLSWLREGSAAYDQNRGNDVHDYRTFTDFTARDDWTLTFADRAAIKFGGEAHAMRASYDYVGIHVTSAVNNGAIVQTIRDVTADLAPHGSYVGAYVAPRVTLASWLTGEVGARVDRVSYTSDALFSPRGNLVANVTPSTALRLAMGRYNQPQPIFALQVGDDVTQFGSADISDQSAASIEQQIGGGVSLRGEVYERRMIHERPRYFNYRMNTSVFPEYQADRTLLPATSGRARGLEVMARRRAIDGFEWSASYALANVSDDVGGVELPRTYDQRHTMYLDASYHPAGSSWRLSGAWQIHSGWPQAPVSFTVDTLRGGPPLSVVVRQQYGPLATLGQQRLPWYRRLDLRFTRDVVTSRGRLSFFADIFNVFNASNPRNDNYSYSLRNGQFDVNAMPNSQIGRFPSAGVSWDF